MDLARANYVVDSIHNLACDLHNLAQEERDVIARDWLERFSVALQLRAFEVVALPMVGFQEAVPLVTGEAPPLPTPEGVTLCNHVDGYSGH